MRPTLCHLRHSAAHGKGQKSVRKGPGITPPAAADLRDTKWAVPSGTSQPERKPTPPAGAARVQLVRFPLSDRTPAERCGVGTRWAHHESRHPPEPSIRPITLQMATTQDLPVTTVYAVAPAAIHSRYEVLRIPVALRDSCQCSPAVQGFPRDCFFEISDQGGAGRCGPRRRRSVWKNAFQ